MKKIYIASTLLSLSIFANAVERTWIINSGKGFEAINHSLAGNELSAPEIYTTTKQVLLDNASWTSTKVNGQLDAYPTGLELSSTYKIALNNKTFTLSDGSASSTDLRLQLNGLTSVPTSVPTANYIAFKVDGNATITLNCLTTTTTGSSTINLMNTSNSVVATATCTTGSSNATTQVININYIGSATKLYLFSSSTTGINVYSITVIDNPSTDNYSTQAETKLKKVGEVLQNEEAEDVVVYNLSGIKVLSSHDTEIQISALPKGVYVANTAKGSMKFIK